jgi:hypothetical protein
MSGVWEQYPTATGMQWRQRDPESDEPDTPEPDESQDDPRDILKAAGMISAADLDRRCFPPMQWHLPGLVPEGFGLVVAAPKAGKSWMVADAGLACATGGKALGSIDVMQRPVLYMALEDGYRRLQERHRTLMGAQPMPGDMHLIVSATPLTAPCVITAFLGVYGGRQPLIIVDTLVRIRPARRASDDPYQFDYAFAARLKDLVDGYPGAGLLAVHHSRKAVSEDFVDMASGTHGLAGAADYVLVLKHPRLAMHASLLVTGRDVPEAEYALISNQGRGWALDGSSLAAAAEAAERRQLEGKRSDRSLEVLGFIRGRTEDVTPTDVAKATGIPVNQVYVYLKRLTDDGLIVKAERGRYRQNSVRSVRGSNTSNTLPPKADPFCIGCGYFFAANGFHRADCVVGQQDSAP